MADLLEIIANCPEGTRISFLYPCIEGHSAETIVSLDELRALVQGSPSQSYDEAIESFYTTD